MNMLPNAFKVTNLNSIAKKILFVHFFLCGIAFVKLMMLLVVDVYDATLLNFAVGKIGMKALVTGVGKLCVILQYFLGLLFAMMYVLSAYVVLQYGLIRKNAFLMKKPALILYFLLNVIFTIRLVAAGNDFLHWLPFWLFFTMTLPVCWLTLPLQTLPVWPKSLSLSLSAAVLLQVALIFQPMIFKPMLIENDYMDISGQTQLQNGTWVDNTKFINQHNIGGIIKYDPRFDHGKEPEQRSGTFVSVSSNPLFNQFLAMNRFNQQYHLVYDARKNTLLVKGAMPAQDHVLLSDAFTDAQDKARIDQLYLLSAEQKDFYENRVYTPIEWDFIEKNQTELVDQARLGWFFYHHNYFFTPIFAAAHGGNLGQITMVYGWLNTLLFAKVLTWMGGVSYQNYFHLLFSFYPPYYLGFLLLVLLIFKKPEYGLLGLLLAVAGLQGIGIELIRLWPGLNPLRHFLDLPVFLCFYFYACNRKLGWLLLSYAFSFVALCCSKEFGLFLIGALSATVVIRAMYERKGLSAAITAILAAVGGMLAFLIIPGKNPGYHYLLLGIGSPVTPSSVVVTTLVFSAILYYAALLFRNITDPINYFWLSVLFYCQFLMVYVLWFPQPHHLLNIAVPLTLLALCFIYLLIRYCNTIPAERSILSFCLMLALMVYAPLTFSFYFQSNHYYRNFATHKLYTWPFATAQLESTMDPQLFINAAALINKYAHENSIYIISRYDTLLPILAGKYSAMPYNELPTNIITTNDVQFLADFFAAKKPKYVFVDTDIERDFNNDIFMPNDPLSKQLRLDVSSASRASTLVVLKQAFAKIKNDYQSIANGELITVYQRKS